MFVTALIAAAILIIIAWTNGKMSVALNIRSLFVIRDELQQQQVSIHNDFVAITKKLYIGPLNATTKSRLPAMNPNYTADYSIWVASGIATVDFIIAGISEWADDVFDEDYSLPLLRDVGVYIQAHKHLPGVPTASDVKKDGISTNEMLTTLLRKVEELTLYTIERDERILQLEMEAKNSFRW